MIWWPEQIPTLTSAAADKSLHVTLRPMELGDAEDIYRACQDPEIPKFTTLPSEYSMDLAISFAGERNIASHANRTELVFVIEFTYSEKVYDTSADAVTSPDAVSSADAFTSAEINSESSKKFAGVISLHTIDIPNHRAEIGYWIAKEARGKGIGTISAELITEYGLMTMGFRRISGLVDVRNEASKKLLLNAGYEFEGNLKKYVTRRDGTQIDMALFAASKI